MKEWDQVRAESRSLETMRRIAQNALQFRDDDDAYYRYAAEHMLTVNEIAYYLNTYEYGGDEGLQAIRLPDIIPAGVAGRALKSISKMLDSHFEGRLPYRLTDEGTAIGLYEIQQRYHSGESYLFPVAQLRLTVASNHWHLYWMRKFGAWWPYEPSARGQQYSLKARVQQILEDDYGCLWG